MSSMCKINPASPACTHWHGEMCSQCLDWKLGQGKEQAHKLITADECIRMKRAIQATIEEQDQKTDSMTLLLLLFGILFVILIICWFLAKAFIFKTPKHKEADPKPKEENRQEGGGDYASLDEIARRLREKCAASTKIRNAIGPNCRELYVPPKFFQRYSADEESPRLSQKKYELVSGQKQESDDESCSEEESEGDENECSTASDDSTESSEEECGGNADDEAVSVDSQCVNKSLESIGKMPTFYGHLTTNSSLDRSPGKMRWANWLTRKRQFDSEV